MKCPKHGTEMYEETEDCRRCVDGSDMEDDMGRCISCRGTGTHEYQVCDRCDDEALDEMEHEK